MTETEMESSVSTLTKDAADRESLGAEPVPLEVALLTGCQDRPYACELAISLASKGITLDVLGSDEVDSPEFHTTRKLRFLNLRGSQTEKISSARKLWKIVVYYARLAGYVAGCKAKILHILWNNKFEYFDRTLVMLYYKLLGKRVAMTAHNVNQRRRDGNDSLLNRVTLRIQYRLTDHIFVHTKKMKDELLQDFGVSEHAVTVIRHPINNAFPDTDLTPSEAKCRLGIRATERAVLFLGRIRPYKGLELLLAAFKRLTADGGNYRLVVAGEPKKGSEEYLDQIRQTISRDFLPEQVVFKVEFIPDDQMELYLKAADVMVLPYKEIFQSGILFLGYSFGLPVIATNVGSFREEIVEGKTGFLCEAGDEVAMARTIEKYFASDIYNDLSNRRREIRDYAKAQHSWHAVAGLTVAAYEKFSRSPWS